MKTIARLVALLAVVLAACTRNPEGQTGKQADDIPVGVYLSLTGSEATFGNETLEGIRLAADEINASGGVLGKKIRLVVEDDAGKQEEAASVVTKLITSDHVVAVIGENISSCSLAAAPICQEAKVPMISPSSTNPEVTKKGDYIFRVCFIDSYQGAAIATFAADSLRAKTAAIVRDVKSDYSMGLARFFAETFTARGGRIVADQSYSGGDSDFRAQLTAINKARPELVMVPGYYTDVAQIAIQARDLGLNVPILGGDGWESPKLLEIGGRNLDGCYYASPVYFSEQGSPEMQRFIAAIRKRYGKEPAALNALGYDALRVFADAARRAGSVDGKAVRDALATTRGFPGPSGVTTIGPDRNPIKPVAMIKIENGETRFAGWVTP